MRLSSLAAAALVLALGGCSSLGILESKKVDYKSQGKIENTLEMPPDLIGPQGDGRYALPAAAATATTTYSAYAQGTQAQAGAEQQTVLPKVPGVRLDRSGAETWLVVEQSPEELWPKLADFWQSMGFVLEKNDQQTGVMQTGWAENRANIPQDFIRRTLGKVFDGLYSTPYRDRFRTWIERDPKGGTDVFVSHEGVQEVYTSSGQDQTKWEPAPPKPGLVVEMQRRLMTFLGVPKAQAQQALAQAPRPDHAQIVSSGPDAPTLVVDESLDPAWQRVGVALNRVGFVVEDRDRAKGLYYVRYIDPAAEQQGKPSWFSKLAFWRKSKPEATPQIHILVSAQGNDKTQVSVLPGVQGTVVEPHTREQIISLLYQQLR